MVALGFVLCWSSGFIGAKLGVGHGSALTLLMWRFVPLAAVLAVVLWVRGQRSDTRPSGQRLGLTGRRLGREVLVGLLSQSGYLLTVYLAIELGVSSGTTALIDGSQPLVVGALAGPLLRERVSIRQWIGLGLGLAGVLVVIRADAGDHTDVARWAYAVPFLGMLCLAAATMLERRSTSAHPPLVALTVHCATSAVVFSALAAAFGVVTPPADATFWLAVGWLVVLSTCGGYGLYWLLLRRRGVTTVNALMFLMAPVTAVWGAAMFREALGWQTVVGLLLGVVAVGVVQAGFRKRPPTVGCGA